MKWEKEWKLTIWPHVSLNFSKRKDCVACDFTIFVIAVHHYCLQTACLSSIFRSGLDTRIFQQRQIFMLIWIIVQRLLRLSGNGKRIAIARSRRFHKPMEQRYFKLGCAKNVVGSDHLLLKKQKEKSLKSAWLQAFSVAEMERFELSRAVTHLPHFEFSNQLSKNRLL